jgi:hypothetical protein
MSELPPGVYKGSFSLAVSEKTDPETLNLTIYSRPQWALTAGLLCLAGGVLLSLAIQFLLRNWFQRAKDKEILVLLRSSLDTFEGEFAALPANLRSRANRWLQRAGTIKQDITTAQQRLIRPLLPQPFEAEVNSIQTLKTEAERIGAEITHLRLLLREGLTTVADIQRQHADRQTECGDAAAQIAAIPAGSEAATAIATTLRSLRTAIGPQPESPLAGGPSPVPRGTGELQLISLQILAVSLVAWLLWAAVSIISGAWLVIYSNPGFGTPTDLIMCALWGLGITVLGQQASQLTPSGIAGSIGIKMPK